MTIGRRYTSDSVRLASPYDEMKGGQVPVSNEDYEEKRPYPLDRLLTMSEEDMTDEEKQILREFEDEQAAMKKDYEDTNKANVHEMEEIRAGKQSNLDENIKICNDMYDKSKEEKRVEELVQIYE